MIILRNLDEAEDLLVGASILATGGGGSPSLGLKLVKDVLDKGVFIKIVDLEEIEWNNGVLVSPYFIGSMGSLSESREARIKDMLLKAIEVIEKAIGRKVVGFVSSELGGSNTAVPLYASALVGIPVVDGDLMGRAGPELHQSTAHIFNVRVTPSVVISPSGTIVLFEDIANVDDYESIAGHIARISGGWSLVIDTPLTRSDAEKVIIRNTLSLSMKLGRSLREARGKGFNALNVILNTLNGWVIFDGVVSKVDLRNTGRFLEGYVELKGDKGRLRIYVKNEYLMAWLNETPIVMCPDLIILLDEEGRPILSNMVKEGIRGIVVASRAPSVWRSERGLELFGPRHFGFDYEYKPVEELIGGGYAGGL